MAFGKSRYCRKHDTKYKGSTCPQCNPTAKAKKPGQGRAACGPSRTAAPAAAASRTGGPRAGPAGPASRSTPSRGKGARVAGRIIDPPHAP